MKKLLGVIAALFLAGNLFAINVDTYGSLGYTYGLNYLFPKGSDAINISGQGFNFNVSSYFLGDLGFFANSSTTFGSKAATGDKETMFDFGIGLTYRHEIHSTLEVYGSAGATIESFSYMIGEDKAGLSAFGACLDLGARVIATDFLFFDAGVYTSYTFSDISIQKNNKELNTGKGNFLSVKPHIGIGFIYRESF